MSLLLPSWKYQISWFPKSWQRVMQWEKLSQSLGSTPQWLLVDKGNKVTLLAAQEDETIMEYNRTLGSVTSGSIPLGRKY